MNNEEYEMLLKELDDDTLVKLLRIVSEAYGRERKHKAQFNVIDELHADENAHTRILSSLLKIDYVRMSFLRMLRGHLTRKDILSDDMISHTKGDEVNVFSQYVDAQIVHQSQHGAESLAIIIENKIKGAVDQSRQLERYIETIKDSYQIGVNRIIVVYLTLRGEKEVSSDSLPDKTKKRICEYIPLSYLEHIIPWLENQLCFSLGQIHSEPYLSSGITQYIHHLKGLVGQRQNGNDVFAKNLALEIGRGLGTINPYLALARVNYEIGLLIEGDSIGRFIESGLLDRSSKFIKPLLKQCLRRKFYWHFNEVVTDDDNGTYIELRNYALAMYDAYEGQPSDLLYIDFFYENGTESEYQKCLKEFSRRLKHNRLNYWDDLRHNNQKYIRVFISSNGELETFFDALPMSASSRKEVVEAEPNITMSPDKLESLVKLQNVLQFYNDNLDEEAAKRFADPYSCRPRTTWYAYQGRYKWAWQRAPWNGYSEAEIQVFPRNHGDERYLIDYIANCGHCLPTRRIKWNGRAVIAFPLKDGNYERELLRLLGKWELDGGEPVLKGIPELSYEMDANAILRNDVITELGTSWYVEGTCWYGCRNEEAMVTYSVKRPDTLASGVKICCVFDQKGFKGCQIAAWKGEAQISNMENRVDERTKDEWHIDDNDSWLAWKAIRVDETDSERGMIWDKQFFERIQNETYRKRVVKELVNSILILNAMLNSN